MDGFTTYICWTEIMFRLENEWTLRAAKARKICIDLTTVYGLEWGRLGSTPAQRIRGVLTGSSPLRTTQNQPLHWPVDTTLANPRANVRPKNAVGASYFFEVEEGNVAGFSTLLGTRALTWYLQLRPTWTDGDQLGYFCACCIGKAGLHWPLQSIRVMESFCRVVNRLISLVRFWWEWSVSRMLLVCIAWGRVLDLLIVMLVTSKNFFFWEQCSWTQRRYWPASSCALIGRIQCGWEVNVAFVHEQLCWYGFRHCVHFARTEK